MSLLDAISKLQTRVAAVAKSVDLEPKVELKKKIVSTKKIVVPRITVDKRKIKGADWFSTAFANMYACSMKGSGKTTIITNIIWHCIGTDTKVLVFSPTVHLDKTWIDMIKKLESKGYNVSSHESLRDEDGVNLIEQFMQENRIESDDEDSDLDEKRPDNVSIPSSMPTFIPKIPMSGPKICCSAVAKVDDKPKAKPKKSTITPRYIVVCDDLGSEMRDKALGQLMRTNRHYKSIVICASQHLNDLTPAQIKQLGYVFLFSKFSEEKLTDLYKLLDISLPFDKFLQIYRDATNKPFSFLYIGRASGSDEFRKGFNEKYVL